MWRDERRCRTRSPRGSGTLQGDARPPHRQARGCSAATAREFSQDARAAGALRGFKAALHESSRCPRTGGGRDLTFTSQPVMRALRPRLGPVRLWQGAGGGLRSGGPSRRPSGAAQARRSGCPSLARRSAVTQRALGARRRGEQRVCMQLGQPGRGSLGRMEPTPARPLMICFIRLLGASSTGFHARHACPPERRERRAPADFPCIKVPQRGRSTRRGSGRLLVIVQMSRWQAISSDRI